MVRTAVQALVRRKSLEANKSRGRPAASTSRIGLRSVRVAVRVVIDPANDPVREGVVDEHAYRPKGPEERAVNAKERPRREERPTCEKRPMREARKAPGVHENASVRSSKPSRESKPRPAVPGGSDRRCRTKRKCGSKSQSSDPADQSCFLLHICLQQSQLATRVPERAIRKAVQVMLFQLLPTDSLVRSSRGLSPSRYKLTTAGGNGACPESCPEPRPEVPRRSRRGARSRPLRPRSRRGGESRV